MTLARLSRLLAKNRQIGKLYISTSSGIFGVPQLQQADGFVDLEAQVRKQCEILVKEANSANRKRKMVQIFDDLSDSICRVADLAECMRNLHPDPNFAAYAENCVASIGELVENFNTDYSLYSKLKENLNDGDAVDRRVAELFAIDFEASGVHLPENQRKTFVEFSAEIFRLSSEFVRLCQYHQPSEDSANFNETSSNLVLASTSTADCSLWASSSDAQVRKALYHRYYAPLQMQEEVLRRLLDQRQKLAQICGFKTYAHRALRGSLLETPENVEQFLRTLIKRLTPLAENDLTVLKKYSCDDTLAVWDVPYYSHLAKQDYLRNISSKIGNCFSLSTALNGINSVIKSLFNVSLKKVDSQPGELWHSDVDKMIVCDENSNVLGTIYCDWFDRPNKMVSDSHFTVRCGRQLPNGDYQLPIVVLAFRHQRSRNRNFETRISLHEMENVLHEFGHALHSIFGRTRYQHVSGTRCSTDFAEIPSNLMEHYAKNNKTLPYFVCNDNSSTLAPSDAKKLLHSTKMFSSLDLLKQSIYALFDLRLHSEILPPSVSSCEIFENICREYFPFLNAPGTAWHHRFSHLVHYGSKYNAYLVAASSANDIWHQCFENNPLNRETGERWRNVLAFGGERPPAELLELMLNKKPTIDSLANAVVDSLNIE